MAWFNGKLEGTNVSDENLVWAIEWANNSIRKTNYIIDEKVRKMVEYFNSVIKNSIGHITNKIVCGDAGDDIQINADGKRLELTHSKAGVNNQIRIMRRSVRIKQNNRRITIRCMSLYPYGRFMGRGYPVIVAGLGSYYEAMIMPSGSVKFFKGINKEECSEQERIGARGVLYRIMQEVRENDPWNGNGKKCKKGLTF